MYTAIGLILIVLPTLCWIASIIGVALVAISTIGSTRTIKNVVLVNTQAVLTLLSIGIGILVLCFGYGLV